MAKGVPADSFVDAELFRHRLDMVTHYRAQPNRLLSPLRTGAIRVSCPQVIGRLLIRRLLVPGQGWLSGRSDYIAADELFSILRQHAVRFYSDGLAATISFLSYSEDDDETLREVQDEEPPAAPLGLPAVPSL